MTEFFQFEAEFVDSLRCIPMQVRYKLDTCGIKLKLAQWNHFNQDDRETLVTLPCHTDAEIQYYRSVLHHMIQSRTGTSATELAIDPAPAWLDVDRVPDAVQAKAADVGASLVPAQWANLTPLQRFALIKLSRSSHENHNFLPALKEFHLV